MDVRLSPEQQALRDAVAAAVHRLGPATVRDLDDMARVAKLHAAVEAAGWRELRAGGDAGRPWASGVEVALVAEELGRGVADVAFVGPTLAVELRRLAGSAAPAAETIACRVDFGGLGADLAVDAAGARTALLADGGALFSVPVYEPSTALDLTRPTARAGTVASPVQGSLDDADFDRWTALGLALTSADLVGVMGGAIELACNYARGRRQYGTPIGSFQAVQHLLADAHTLMEGSRSTTLHAAWAVDALPPAQALAAAAAAKAYCSRAARTVCETTIQVHGGIGNTWDCMAHVFLRRALLSIDLLGGVGPNLERVLAAHGLATV